MAGIEGDCGSLGSELFLHATAPLGLACYFGFLLSSQGLTFALTLYSHEAS